MIEIVSIMMAWAAALGVMVLHVQERKLWDRERQLLLDRIQARDLGEYKALQQAPAKKAPEPAKDRLNQI
jgi:hypothetical protein